MIYFLCVFGGVVFGYWLATDSKKDEMRMWDNICAVCHEYCDDKDAMSVGQKTNDKEASVVTTLLGHRKCLMPIAKEVVEQRDDLRRFRRENAN